ncbi:hypothetical protein [Winogradskya humida]|nr:hypothetical protein [Actinoplanes humidus]
MLALLDKKLGKTTALPDTTVERLRCYIEHMEPSRIDVGWMAAGRLRNVWRDRYEAYDLESTRAGWGMFFAPLESERGAVGLVGLSNGGPAQFMLVLSEAGDRILACVSRNEEEVRPPAG